ncbi:alpha/beta fold hydrolase [Rufibacter tibetensis]|uniref:Sigma factor sigB regulation protein rsbQ n=1 Tax=Rufibacter tibetensis TaxID=512763 RepID=A0A0P0CLA2_9BACT|nr:alpha/beta hydrolase [Rufibacter tibetensis]ALJ00391.1 sigma factor sigB regulation protein rsbQ [Rufibacter tibetensis]
MNALKRNNVTILGKGETPMLFAHGYGCDQNMWRFITPAFEEDYKIVLFDHVGFGKADTSVYTLERYSSLQSYAVDILEICEELNLKDVIFVGHSVSAMIGVLASILAPDYFSKLVLIGPSPRYINDENYEGGFTQEGIDSLLESLDSDYLSWSAAIAPVIMGNPQKAELSQELTQSFCRSNVEVAKDFARITFLSDNRADLPNVKTPALILQCTDDVIAPLPVGKYMHEHLPSSSFKVLNATGHCPNLSAPEETISAIKEFL